MGIGTSNPLTLLDVQGDFNVGNSAFKVHSNNKVGIGINVPNSDLHIRRPYQVKPTIQLSEAGTHDGCPDPQFCPDKNWFIKGSSNFTVNYNNVNPYLTIRENGRASFGDLTDVQQKGKLNIKANSGEPGIVLTSASPTYSDVEARMSISAFGAVGGLRFETSPDNGSTLHDGLFIANTGQVGINTTAPDASFRLSVNGAIRAKEILVETGWSDFVFEENYRLRKLEEVELFIKNHKHLPGIPPGEKVESEGVAVGEMLSLQMMKIEELFLYIIELKKENEELREMINNL